MVKVLILKQLFDSQSVVPIDEEPIEIRATGKENTFLVATKEGIR